MTSVAFHPLRHEDLPQLVAWFAEPEVLRWYARTPKTLSDLQERYGPCIDGTKPNRCFLIALDDTHAGFIKTYRVADWPDYARAIDADDSWSGIDYLIGEPQFRGRGLASTWLRAFVDDVVFADPQVTACVSGPNPENLASVRALQRAGFRPLRVAQGDNGDTEHLHILERLARVETAGRSG